MIDIESQVFNELAAPLRLIYTNPKIFITGEPVKVPASYPAVTIVEFDNSTYEKTLDSSDKEHHASVSYEINIYSNKQLGKKAECKAIAAKIDEIMQSIGFKRISLNQIPNLDDATIFRIISRYRAVVSEDETIYKI